MVIKFELQIRCEDSEPSRYVSLYRGTIVDYPIEPDGHGEPNVEVGEVQVYLVNRGRIIDEHGSLFDAMDATSSETMDCYEAIIDQQTDDWKDEVQSLIGEDAMISYDILLINRLELKEEFRGKGIGARVAREVINALGPNCAVIACKPLPLQYVGYLGREHTEERAAPGYEKKRLAALRKVAAFWKKVGFRKLSSSDHYVWVRK
jgi:GNAT superfamily N-acetyltransferase